MRTILPWRLVALSVLVVTASTQAVFLLGAAFLDMGPELGYGPAGLGALTALFFLTASLASAPLGRLVQRIGWRTAMRINAVASGVLTAAVAVLVQNVWVLAVLLVAAAAVYGLANPAANLALAEHVDPQRRGVVFGIKHAGIPASTLVAGLAVPLVVLTLGWRAAYGISAVLALVVLALVPSVEPTPARRLADEPSRGGTLSTRLLVALGAGSALATWAAVALSTYLVAAAVDVGLSEAAAGLLLFGGSAASIAARMGMGHLTDRIGGSGFGGIAALTGVGAAVFVALVPAAGAGFALLVVLAFMTGWGWPGLMTFTVVNANAGSAAASSAVTQAGVFLGAGVGPLVVGTVVDRVSFDAAWLVVAGALAVATVTVSWVGRHAAQAARPV